MLCSGREECDRGGGELPEGEVPRAGDATDLRLAMDERTVLQQMFDEKSGEVELLQQRLAAWQVNQHFTVPLQWVPQYKGS